MSDITFFIPAVLGGLAFLFRLPGLIRNPRDTLLWCVASLLLTACGVFFFASIPVIAAVNDLTGIPNFSGPLVYCVLTAYSGSCLVLLINWRGGPPDQVRRATRLCIALYSGICALLFVLFFLAGHTVERLRDLDTYFANTPYMREMIVLYLTAHAVSAIVMTTLCWRWSREVDGALRTGLYLMVPGILLTLAYDALKFAAVGARWAGHDWDFLGTDIARPIAAAGAPLIAVGFGYPLVAQRLSSTLSDRRRYRQLGLLWHVTRELTGADRSTAVPPWTSPGMRLLQRERDIHDALLALNPYFDEAVRTRAHTDALATGKARQEADAAADAAMILAALDAVRADPDRHVIASTQALQAVAGENSRSLVAISAALSQSPNGAHTSVTANG
ncbi:MAB_1171c family putative transporter [Streptomyces sp. NPDC086783]|uniref:MAB_1171c family putative transporter n=1 Tax=Streptomyces sp. NPDC086783 TaxID=3365758 RepID=UPI0037F20F75